MGDAPRNVIGGLPFRPRGNRVTRNPAVSPVVKEPPPNHSAVNAAHHSKSMSDLKIANNPNNHSPNASAVAAESPTNDGNAANLSDHSGDEVKNEYHAGSGELTVKEFRHTTPAATVKSYSLSDEEIEHGVNTLYSKGIRMLAWDFDLTAYRKHTGGGVPFNSNIPEITKYLSPIFISVVPVAQKYGIRIAIVTYSDDSDDNSFGGNMFISTVLTSCFRRKDVWHRILVAAANPELHQQPLDNDEDPTSNSSERMSQLRGPSNCEVSECECLRQTEPFHVSRCVGKEWHLARVIEEHKSRTGIILERKQVLLIDDSMPNIRQAKKDGYRAFEVPTKGLKNAGVDADVWKNLITCAESDSI
jgi:hypothetical protein